MVPMSCSPQDCSIPDMSCCWGVLTAVAEVQKAGGQAVFVDAEHAFNIHFARRLGVNVDVSPLVKLSFGAHGQLF